MSICIPSWNRSDLLQLCLDSIFLHLNGKAFEVIVVDNGSTDDNVTMVTGHFPAVRLVCNDSNKGFAYACNQALRIAQGDFLLLLNSDVRLVDDSIWHLVGRMTEIEQCGACTCYILSESNVPHKLLPFFYCFPTPWVLIRSEVLTMTGLARLFQNRAWMENWVWRGRNPDNEQEVAHVNGACLLVRRAILDVVGLLDESFFLFLEETDWCYRMREKGWSIWYLPVARVVHLGSGSVSLRKDSEQLYVRSYSYFFRKHYGRSAEIAFRVYRALVHPPFAAFYRLAKRVQKHFSSAIA